MVKPEEPDKKQEQKKDNFNKEHKAALGIVSQLVRYVPRTRIRPSRLTTTCQAQPRRGRRTLCALGAKHRLGTALR